MIRQLEWQPIYVDRGDGGQDEAGWEADTGFGVFYGIDEYFGSDSYGWKVCMDYEAIGDFDDPEKAKACAQADFERRIQSALKTEKDKP